MRGARALLLGLLAAGFAGACSSSPARGGSDAGRDASGAMDRPSPEHPIDATSSPDGHDAASDRQDGGGGCSPLDTSMWPVSQCAATWAAVVAYPACTEQASAQRISVDCGAYHSVTQFGGDSTVSCWYGITSGALVAVSSTSNGSPKCWGPPGGIAPTCPNAIATTICTSDGGAAADGGAGNCLSASSLPRLTWNDPCAAHALCYADCMVDGAKYVGCVSGTSTGTRCYASCSECP